jgi:hypothetical protein
MDTPWKWVGLGATALIGVVVLILIITGGDATPEAGDTTTSTVSSTAPSGTDTTAGPSTTASGATTTTANGATTTTTAPGATTTTAGETTTTTTAPGATTTTAGETTTTTTTRATGTTTTTVAGTTTTIADLPTEFGDGTFLVGVDIAPGLYESTGGFLCYWERLSGTSGAIEDVIANDVPTGKAIVAIAPSDAAFGAEGCGDWARFQPYSEPVNEFGDGTWAVGTQIEPGRYGADGGEYCYWARLSGFGGVPEEDIIDFDFSTEPQVVDIDASDAGFAVDGCGTWTKAG